MNCPLCVEVHLDVTFRHGIEIDVCPRCRGIWLDRGELERLAGERPYAATSPPGRTGPLDDEPSHTSGGQRPRSRRLADRLGEVLEGVLDL